MATLTEIRLDDVTVIRLNGGLTYDGVIPIAKPFEACTRGGAVVVDLSDVPIVTTPGLSLLLSALQRLTHGGGRLVLFGLSRNVLDLLRRCRLDRVFTIAADEAEAVASLREAMQAQPA
jgi:anti-anti-sigma factor